MIPALLACSPHVPQRSATCGEWEDCWLVSRGNDYHVAPPRRATPPSPAGTALQDHLIGLARSRVVTPQEGR